MRRAAFLFVCLSLALTSLVPLTAPVAAQQTLPAPFLGRWQGTVVQGTSEYPAVLDLTGGPAGSVIGAIDYPNLGCGGDLTLAAVLSGGSQVNLYERLNYNASGCWQNGTVSLTLRSDGNLDFAWAHRDFVGQITGILTTAGAPPPADWCTQLVANFAGAASLTGEWEGSLEQRQGTYTSANLGVSVADFVATAIFYNPTTSTTVPWDYGFAFRQTPDQGEVQQIIIDSNGNWYYAYFSRLTPQGVLASGVVPSFTFSPGLPNTLDLVVDGATASFCLNGQFVSTVQLPPAVASDVYLATGFFTANVVSGRLVGYDHFEVWGL